MIKSVSAQCGIHMKRLKSLRVAGTVLLNYGTKEDSMKILMSVLHTCDQSEFCCEEDG